MCNGLGQLDHAQFNVNLAQRIMLFLGQGKTWDTPWRETRFSLHISDAARAHCEPDSCNPTYLKTTCNSSLNYMIAKISDLYVYPPYSWMTSRLRERQVFIPGISSNWPCQGRVGEYLRRCSVMRGHSRGGCDRRRCCGCLALNIKWSNKSHSQLRFSIFVEGPYLYVGAAAQPKMCKCEMSDLYLVTNYNAE